MKLAAIDIGSNAIRLQITRIIPHDDGSLAYKRLETIRFPLRLGDDAFRMGEITFRNEIKFIELMMAFRTLIDLYEVDDAYGCATAALRDSINGARILQRAYEKSGLHIDVITGDGEADLLLRAVTKFIDLGYYVHVDVGGGSTEISLIKDKECFARQSFKLGSVRNMRKRNDVKEWDRMKEWLEANKPGVPMKAIGTGGNIRSIHKVAEPKRLKPMTYKKLLETVKKITNYSITDRIDLLAMREDRADVIPYASEMYVKAMEWSGATEMIIPDAGLKDGIIEMLYERIR
ncbi:MAG: phosphatase [Cyclobacteriaceae bacterium]|nr:phosphatase [Cyclobacteriaceae bacterium]